MKDLRKVMYMVVDRNGKSDMRTLSSCKKECKKSFLNEFISDWRNTRATGWKVVKVDVTISKSNLQARE